MSNSENWVSHTPATTTLPQDYSNKNASPSSSSKENNFEPQQEQEQHRPPSPPSVFEKFFLPIEDPIGFAQAASRINSNNRRTSNSQLNTTESIRTNDFVTAAEDLELDSAIDSDEDLNPLSTDNQLYTNDILGLSQPPILEEHESNNQSSTAPEEDKEVQEEEPLEKEQEEVSDEPETINMTSQETKISTPLEETTTPVPTEPESPHFDVVDHVYGAYKSVWGFSKEHIIVLKPFMSLTEHVATKILSTATGGSVSSLEVADENITKHIKGIDSDLIDPAILKLWSVVEPLVGKGTEVAEGIMGFIHKKPMIEEEEIEATGPEAEETPVKGKESTEVSAPETSTPAIST